MVPLDDNILRAFGQISVNFSQLEEQLFYYTALLVSPADQDIGYVTLAGLNFYNLSLKFKALIFERTSLRYSMVRRPLGRNAGEIRSRATALFAQIDEVRISRNDYIHSHWDTSSVYNEEAEEFQTSAGVAELTKHDRHSYVSKTTTQNVAELEAVAENIHIVFIELLSFVGWTNTVLPPAIALFPPQEDSAGIVGVLPT